MCGVLCCIVLCGGVVLCRGCVGRCGMRWSRVGGGGVMRWRLG